MWSCVTLKRNVVQQCTITCHRFSSRHFIAAHWSMGINQSQRKNSLIWQNHHLRRLIITGFCIRFIQFVQLSECCIILSLPKRLLPLAYSVIGFFYYLMCRLETLLTTLLACVPLSHSLTLTVPVQLGHRNPLHGNNIDFYPKILYFFFLSLSLSPFKKVSS